MTIHKAKGLEFDCVMLAGLQEGRFPYYEEDLSLIDRQAQAQMAAERRLFYVAITRAKQRLAFLTAAGKREQSQLEQGQLPVTAADNKGLSRFVFESQPKVIEKILSAQTDTSTVTIKTSRAQPLADYLKSSGLSIDVAFKANDPAKSGQLKPGDKVRHDQYGQGVVVRQEQSGKRMIFVDFESEGLKRFNPKHTKLVPLSRRGSA